MEVQAEVVGEGGVQLGVDVSRVSGYGSSSATDAGYFSRIGFEVDRVVQDGQRVLDYGGQASGDSKHDDRAAILLAHVVGTLGEAGNIGEVSTGVGIHSAHTVGRFAGLD